MLHIRLLDLSSNQLSSLHDLQNLVCLDTLVVDDNKLEEIPSGMGQLQLLRVLSIRNNSIPLCVCVCEREPSSSAVMIVDSHLRAV